MIILAQRYNIFLIYANISLIFLKKVEVKGTGR